MKFKAKDLQLYKIYCTSIAKLFYKGKTILPRQTLWTTFNRQTILPRQNYFTKAKLFYQGKTILPMQNYFTKAKIFYRGKYCGNDLQQDFALSHQLGSIVSEPLLKENLHMTLHINCTNWV